MTINTYLTIAASTVLATACATNNAQKNEDVSQTGLIHVEQVDQLLAQTTDIVIDVDSTELYRLRNHRNKKQEWMLREKNRDTSKLAREIARFRKSNAYTKRYFIELEKLINNPNRQSFSVALGDVTTAMAKEYHRQTKSERFSAYSYDQQGYISNLSTMAVNAHYSKKIQDILRQNAVFMNNHLTLQEDQLKEIILILKDRMKRAELLHLRMNVEEPYLAKQNLILNTWKANRRKWFEMQQAAPAIEDLANAQQNIRKAWERILHGDSSMTSASNMLYDASHMATAIHNVEKAPLH